MAACGFIDAAHFINSVRIKKNRPLGAVQAWGTSGLKTLEHLVRLGIAEVRYSNPHGIPAVQGVKAADKVII